MAKLSDDDLLTAIEYITVAVGSKKTTTDEAFDVASGLHELITNMDAIFAKPVAEQIKQNPDELVKAISQVSVTGIWLIASLVAGSDKKAVKQPFIPPSAM